MKRSKPMKRTAFKRAPRSTEGAEKTKPARAPMRRRSAKQRAVYAGSEGVEGRADFVARILAERPTCEAGPIIAGWAFLQARLPRSHCSIGASEVHEVLRRSAGGDILDDANVLSICARCHRWTHANPKEARTLGLLKSRYPGRNETQE